MLGRLASRVPKLEAADAPTVGQDASRPYLLQMARRAMACEFEVCLPAGQSPNAAQAAVDALDLVEDLESRMTVYRDDSQVSRINREASDRPVPAEAWLFALVQQAIRLHAATGGAFDITSGPLSKVWGFFRRQGRMPDDTQLADALGRVGSQWIHLNETSGTIRFTKPGVEINLGGIGKGYALDRCRRLLVEAGVENFLLHGGQSSVLAHGCRAAGRGGWTVAVRHPLRPEKRLLEIRLEDRALGTSGSGTQCFTHRGRRYGHILDPRTGQPADGVLSSTVVAPTAALADALATAFYVMGLDKARDYCDADPRLGAVIVVGGPRDGSVHIHAIGLGDEQWTRIEDH